MSLYTNTFKNRRPRRHLASLALAAALATSCSGGVAFDDLPTGSALIVDANDVSFVEISPFAQFGPAQGDFTSGAHGTFGIFGAGQASPPHTHSGDYYAVVLEGGDMNNPFGTESTSPTLDAGSFWSVPANAQHITACLDPDEQCRFFFHAASAFDFAPLESMDEERDSRSQTVPAAELRFGELEPYHGAATLWGNTNSGPYGMIVRVDGGGNTSDMSHRNGFTLVPASGSVELVVEGTTTAVSVGSVIETEANTPHELRCVSSSDCLLYLFADAPLEIQS